MPTMTRAGYTPPKPEIKKAPEPKKPGKKKKKGRKKRGMSGAAIASLAIFLLAAAIGAGTLYIYAQTQPYQQAFVPGTILMGYPLAGATRADAERLLNALGAEHVDTWQYELSCMGRTYTLTAQDVDLAIDREETLAKLWQAGHTGGMLTRYREMQRLSREALVQPYPVLTYEMTALDALLERICAETECDAVDATVTYTPGSAAPFTFTQEETGFSLDVSGVSAEIERDLLRLVSGSVALEPTVIEPQVYQAELESAISLRARVVAQVTGDEATVHNVTLAAQALCGLRVDSGEALSFNEAVGARTQENGYLAAKEPAYGEDVSGVGGGVCQVSTALHRAALLGGLDVRERSAAVRPVDYCDMGQEAAVSDQGLDLVIVNKTDAPLFVSARVYEDDGAVYLELMLIGEELGRRCRLNSLIDELGTIEEPVYVRDREGQYATYTDERVPVGEALAGYEVSVERVTLDENGLETAAEIVSESVYEAVAPTIYVGVQQRDAE
ncbi:MAG: VanW family protein [Candidatus Ventricola sp.]